jgi:hypothetical protein
LRRGAGRVVVAVLRVVVVWVGLGCREVVGRAVWVRRVGGMLRRMGGRIRRRLGRALEGERSSRWLRAVRRTAGCSLVLRGGGGTIRVLRRTLA